jgi:hypothetical protein
MTRVDWEKRRTRNIASLIQYRGRLSIRDLVRVVRTWNRRDAMDIGRHRDGEPATTAFEQLFADGHDCAHPKCRFKTP